jgi:nitrate/nitrite-specific signal transduction histidine kinase
VRVRDDGSGIDEQILNSGKSGHWGLSGMRERAEKIGAQFKIWSRPGAGTEVEVIIPAKVAYPRTQKSSPWLRAKSAMSGKGQG